MFGASSEAHLGQGLLFNEAEALAAPDLGDDADQDTEPDNHDAGRARSSGRGKSPPLPPRLPRVYIVSDVPEAQRLCASGQHLVKIGADRQSAVQGTSASERVMLGGRR